MRNPSSGAEKQVKIALFRKPGEAAGARRGISEILKWLNYVTENRVLTVAADLSESVNLEHGSLWGHYDPESNPSGTRLKAAIQEAGNYFALTRHTIDTRAIIARLLTGAEGAVVTFEGTVRNHTKGRPTRCLDYECYESMALKMMVQIGREIALPAADVQHARHRNTGANACTAKHSEDQLSAEALCRVAFRRRCVVVPVAVPVIAPRHHSRGGAHAANRLPSRASRRICEFFSVFNITVQGLE